MNKRLTADGSTAPDFDQSLKYCVRIDDHTMTRPASSMILNNIRIDDIFYEFYRIDL